MTVHQLHHPDDLSPEKRDRMCPSCRTRYRYPEPAPSEEYGPLEIDGKAYRWLVNAARMWDLLATEPHTAAEFIAWIRYDLVGNRIQISERAGGPGHPDPVPFAELPRTWNR